MDEPVYEVDRRALAGAVATALELARDLADRAAAHLGPFTSIDGARHTCFLIFTATLDETRPVIPRLRPAGDEPLLLLCASRRLTATTYRYTLAESVPVEEAEATMLLSLFATEALCGEAQTRLDAEHSLDRAARTVAIDASTEVGRALCRVS